MSNSFLLAQLTNPVLNIASETSGTTYINGILSNVVLIGILAGAVIFFFMFMLGALEWIFSGGDSRKIENAKKRIMNALVGLIILLAVFVIVRLVNLILNMNVGNLGIGGDTYQQSCTTSGSSCRCLCNSGYHPAQTPDECSGVSADQCSGSWCMCVKNVPPSGTPAPPMATSTPMATVTQASTPVPPSTYCVIGSISCIGTFDHGICVNPGSGCSCDDVCTHLGSHVCDSVGLNSAATDGLMMEANGSSCVVSSGTNCSDVMYSTGSSCSYSGLTYSSDWTRCSCVFSAAP